jgi:hypothetical protein
MQSCLPVSAGVAVPRGVARLGSGVARRRCARPFALGKARAAALGPQDDSTFGKPAAPRDIWTSFAETFRRDFLAAAAVADGSGGDVARAALLLAAEDDAVASRTAVPLPIDSYVGRVDTLASDFTAQYAAPSPADPDAVLAALDAFLYGEDGCRFRVPTTWVEASSPYRTYLHNVLAQKVGVPAALATIHLAVLQRLQAAGVAPADAQVVLSPLGGRPLSRRGDASSFPPAVTPAGLLVTTLVVLQRAFWAWEWAPEEASGFTRAARAAAGLEGGRIGQMMGGVVMQPTGRPFGDPERAQLAVERLLALAGGQGAPLRDLAVLQAHLKQKTKALANLKAYVASPAGVEAAAAAAVGASPYLVAEQEALQALLLSLEKSRLEGLL